MVAPINPEPPLTLPGLAGTTIVVTGADSGQGLAETLVLAASEFGPRGVKRTSDALAAAAPPSQSQRK